MNWQRVLSVALASLLLSACAPGGPVRFYSGSDKPAREIAIVRVPGPITTLAIDGRDIRSPSQEKGFYELHLTPGRHTITFKYELYWGTDYSGMLVKSDPTSVQAELAAGQIYELRYEEPGNEDEAFNLASDFQATLVESDSDTPIAASASDEYPTGYTNTGPVVRDTIATTQPNANQVAGKDAVKQLKFWWRMADEQEREAFRKWMQQEMPNFNEKE